jgi:hypothetical protein
MLNLCDEKIKKATFEDASENYFELKCCLKEISESEFLDLENIEYYQNKQGDIYCKDCIKFNFDLSLGLQYIKDCELEEDFKEWLPADAIIKMVETYNKHYLENTLKEFCFDDFDTYAEWYVNRKED